MNRRDFLKDTALATAAWMAPKALSETKGGATAERPNIVLIVADDMGFSDLGCYGSEIRTPNLDRLAKGGLRFRQFYNSPRCCPSRATFLTGLYAHQAGMGMMTSDHGRYPYPAYNGDLSQGCVTIAEALKSSGYATLMAGKWHLTPFQAPKPGVEQDKHNWPLQRGFDHYYGILNGASSYFKPTSLARDNELIEENSPGFYLTDAIADNAVRMLGDAEGSGKPIFLYTAFNAPHWPLHAPEETIAKYRRLYRQGWDQTRANRHEAQIRMGIVEERWPLSARDPRVPAWTRASYHDWEAERMAVYAAQVDRLDAGVGRILAKLEAMGKLDNTLIFFMVDNGGNYEEFDAQESSANTEVRTGNIPTIMPGPANTYQSYGGPWGNVSNTPFRMYKHFAHEGGISSPLILHWPKGIQGAGAISDELGHELDIMATCLDVSGTSYPTTTKAGTPPPPLEGRSLRPVFHGGHIANRSPLFWEHEGNCAVRDGKWKLVSSYPNTWELYDIVEDRTELNNLAEKYPERVVAMAQQYRDWAKRVGAQPWPMPQTPPNQRGGSLPLPAYLKEDRL